MLSRSVPKHENSFTYESIVGQLLQDMVHLAVMLTNLEAFMRTISVLLGFAGLVAGCAQQGSSGGLANFNQVLGALTESDGGGAADSTPANKSGPDGGSSMGGNVQHLPQKDPKVAPDTLADRVRGSLDAEGVTEWANLSGQGLASYQALLTHIPPQTPLEDVQKIAKQKAGYVTYEAAVNAKGGSYDQALKQKLTED